MTAAALTTEANTSYADSPEMPDFKPVIEACANLIGTTARGIVSTGWSAVCSLIDPNIGGGKAFDATCTQVFAATKEIAVAGWDFFKAWRNHHHAMQLARAR